MAEENQINVVQSNIFPLIPLRNIVPFPGTEMALVFGRPQTTAALLEALRFNKTIVVFAQKDGKIDNPGLNDIYQVGVLAKIEHVIQTDGAIHAAIRGIQRVRALRLIQTEPFLKAEVAKFIEVAQEDEKIKFLASYLLRELRKAVNMGKSIDFYALMRAEAGISAYELVDHVAFSLEASVSDKQKILENPSLQERIELTAKHLLEEMKVIELERTIDNKTQAKFDKTMKRTVLEERKRSIEKELKSLGVSGGEESEEVGELREKIKKAKMPLETRKKAEKELKRLSGMPMMAPEFSYIRTYLDWLVEMPWSKKTKNSISLKEAERVLNEDHYALDNAKERIIEYLAVMRLRHKNKSGKARGATNILCFVGPPGVGKTSIGKSVARALGRKFVRISLGGIRDEAEIRGHRRTYVGALPGRIIQGIKNAGTKNPVFMLDEIDKVGVDFRGDPSAALLEALDPEQNKEFSDHYLEVPFDLSEVFFIVTGNVLDTIPPALRDRLEVIRFSGYTEEEKFHIAKKFLIPKQMENNGLTKKDFNLEDKGLKEIISRYTREAGVRELERMIASLGRKVARKIAEKKKFPKKISIEEVRRLLGPRKFSSLIKEKKNEIGMATGLAWAQSGGEILFIEVALMPGKGQLYLTGHLGDVMKESCRAAMSFVRSHFKDFGLKEGFANKLDVHIHVPEGAVPKDGPSAGVAIATALVSALTKKPTRKDIGMTGEITLRGRVLEIGGVKEKVLAAHRAGLTTVILPKDNRKDLVEIPAKVKKDLKFVFAPEINEVLKIALIN